MLQIITPNGGITKNWLTAMTTEKKSEIKTEKLCRTCLSETNELYSIFDIVVGSVTLDFVVATITGLKVP